MTTPTPDQAPISSSAPGGFTAPGASAAPAGSAAPEQERRARDTVAPYRELGALALLGANAALLAFATIHLFVVFGEANQSFSDRAGGEFDTYVGLVSIFFPLAGVLLATFIKPVVSRARLITLGALVEYGVSAVFGLVCLFASFVQTVGADFSGAIIEAFLTLLTRLVWFALLGFAAFIVTRVYQALFYVPKPKAAPVPPGYPQGYGQPGYPQGYGQPGYPPAQGYPQGYAQPGYPAGAGEQPGWAPPPASSAPASAPPASSAPPAPPAPAQPAPPPSGTGQEGAGPRTEEHGSGSDDDPTRRWS